MAVTEKNPEIKPYDERAWAELESGRDASIKVSLNLLKALHKKWVDFMEALTEKDLKKGYYHPATKRTVLLPEAIALYAWHVEHHLAHIRLVVGGKHDRTELTAKIKPMPSTEAPAEKITEATPVAPTGKRGRPAATKPAPVEKVAKTETTPAGKRGRPAATKPAPVEKVAKTETTPAGKRGRPAATKSAPVEKAAKTETAPAGKLGRPAKVVTAETTAKKVATPKAKPAKVKAESEGPKLTRAEVLAKARAARAAKAPAKVKVESEGPKLTRAEVLAIARAARAAKAPAKVKVESEGPKLTRGEALAKARAARAAKAPAKAKPVSEGPKLTRGEALAKARATRAANKAQKMTPAETPVVKAETPAPVTKRTNKKKVSE
jgi:hypothetical protein